MENIFFPSFDIERDLIISPNLQQQEDDTATEKPSSSKEAKYQCEFCEYKTEKKSNYDSHIKFVHMKAKDKCPECGKEISNLNQHLRVSHKIFKSRNVETTCPECNEKFHNLESHMLKAHNTRSSSGHVCEFCCKTFTKKDHLTRHERAVHMGVRQTCPLCSKEFADLEKHIRSKHSQTPSNNKETTEVVKKWCTVCSKWFSNLSQHVKIVHSAVKNYSCQKCGKRFYDNRELRRHHIKYLRTGECRKEGTGEPCKYECELCEYRTNKKGNMEMHRESVHLNIKYNCPECDKQLSSRANLNSHMRNVHDKRLASGSLETAGKMRLLCKLCSYSTTRTGHLDRHILSVHSAAAFETVEQVYQASTQQHAKQHPAPPRANPRLPQFANLVKLESVPDLTTTTPTTTSSQQSETEVQYVPVGQEDTLDTITSTSLQGRASSDSFSIAPTSCLISSSDCIPEETGVQMLATSSLQQREGGRLVLPLMSEDTAFLNLTSGLVLPLDMSSIYYV